MSRRFYPRQRASRQDAAAQGRFHVRNDQSRVDGFNYDPSIYDAAGVVTTNNPIVSEAAIRAGGTVIEFNLTGDDFFLDAAGVSTPFKAGLAGEDADDIVLAEPETVNPKKISIAVDVSADFDLDPEGGIQTYTWAVPVGVFNSGRANAVAIPVAFRVMPLCDVTVSGTVNDPGIGEAAVVTGGGTIIFTIVGDDTFASDVISNGTKLAALIDGLGSDDAADIKAALVAGSFALNAGRTVLTVTLPAVAAYSIAGDDDVTWTLPASAFTTRGVDTDALVVGTITAA